MLTYIVAMFIVEGKINDQKYKGFALLVLKDNDIQLCRTRLLNVYHVTRDTGE